MINLSPYLTFNGNCREAMTFYQECFGGELTFQTVAETPIAAQCPEGMQEHIMHSMLANGGFVLMATDMMPSGHELKPGNDMAMSVNFDSEEEIRACFSKVSDGGRVLDPLGEKFWGAMFGVAQDKYGKVWMFNHQNEESQ